MGSGTIRKCGLIEGGVALLEEVCHCGGVLGGYVGNYMKPYIGRFQSLAAEKNIFSGGGDYVRVCQCREEASAYGAALYQIEKYISKI